MQTKAKGRSSEAKDGISENFDVLVIADNFNAEFLPLTYEKSWVCVLIFACH